MVFEGINVANIFETNSRKKKVLYNNNISFDVKFLIKVVNGSIKSHIIVHVDFHFYHVVDKHLCVIY